MPKRSSQQSSLPAQQRPSQPRSSCVQDMEVLSAFVDGELRLEEDRRLRRHRRTCAVCRLHIRTLTALKDAVVRTVVEHPLPRALRSKVLQQLAAEKKRQS